MPKRRMKDQIYAEKQAESTEVRILYDRKNAARMLSISLRSLDYLLARGELRFRRIGAKILIPHAELLRYSKGHHPQPIRRPVQPVAPPGSPEPVAYAGATGERNGRS